MKNSLIAWVTAGCILVSASAQRGSAATAEEFGFGNLTVNNAPVTGRIPLLLVFFELSTTGNNRQMLVANITTSFDTLFFNVFNVPSINGYYLENSYGRFSWERAGLIGPAVFDDEETILLDAHRSVDSGDGVVRGGLDGGAGIAYALGRIAAKTGYNFAQWDANGDGTIQQRELSIVLIGNNSREGAANRPIGAAGVGLAIPGQNVTLQSLVASVDQRASFVSIAHELSHSLGTDDMYADNCRSSGLTLMSCSIFGVNDDRRTFHLDAWHKMRLGWLRPRIFNLATGGITMVAASQISSPNGPVILYDPGRGTEEFFMVEYRNNQIAGAHHDVNIGDASQATPLTVATNGMAVWHIAAGRPPAYHEGAPNLTLGNSTLWKGPTPLLTWRDGSPTATRLNPIEIVSDGRELIFEWTTASETWVDFLFTGFENGTFSNPFNSLAEAAAAAAHGGTIKIKTGSTGERPSFAKRLTLQAIGGPVTIGR